MDALTGFISGTTEWDIYWSTRAHKKWVVQLKARKVRHELIGKPGTGDKLEWKKHSDKRTMYVTARTKHSAAQCALNNIFDGQRYDVESVRLATATDLGCVRTGEGL